MSKNYNLWTFGGRKNSKMLRSRRKPSRLVHPHTNQKSTINPTKSYISLKIFPPRSQSRKNSINKPKFPLQTQQIHTLNSDPLTHQHLNNPTDLNKTLDYNKTYKIQQKTQHNPPINTPTLSSNKIPTTNFSIYELYLDLY